MLDRTAGVFDQLRTGNSSEIPAFVGGPGEAVYACLHLPDRPAKGLVVICSSIGAEWKYAYRREVILARLLAELDVAAVRFHYLGIGHSDSQSGGFGRMVQDADRVAAWAADRSGSTNTAYAGTRFGAFVAAAAGRPAAAPTVAWGAPATGADYFRELFRVARAARLADSHPQPGDDVPPRARLDAGYPADIVGYTLPVDLYRSAVHLSLEVQLGSAHRDVLLIDSGTAAVQAAPLRARGLRVDTASTPLEESAWLPSGSRQPEENRPGVRPVLRQTGAWLLAALTGTRVMA
jgi:alpha/beta superfamily hydrolase